MKEFWTPLMMFFMFLFFAGCKGEPEIYDVSETDQLVYFQFEYRNSAWGFQHYGWLIDSSGSVHCYNKPEDWFLTDSLGYMPGAEVKSNLLAADSVCCRINKEVLQSKIKLIKDASEGKILEPVHEMYDAGVGIYTAFLYNLQDDTYKKVLLKQKGDFRIDNSAPEAVELYKWLESIQEDIRTE